MTSPLNSLTTVFFAAVCTAFAGVAVAQPMPERSAAEMFKRADTDGDGKVSLDEFIKARTAEIEATFKRLDRDGDGKLSQEEVTAGMARLREAMQRGGAEAGGPGMRDRMQERGSRGPEQGFRRPPQQE